MKSTGIVRKVDELGRIVIPIELRRTLDIGIKDSLEIYVEDDQIILKKYMPACSFCNNAFSSSRARTSVQSALQNSSRILLNKIHRVATPATLIFC